MNEVATGQVQSSSKKDVVLAALAMGKSPSEAAKEAGCAIQYVYGIVKNQKAEAEDDCKDPGLPSRQAIVEHIWPCTMERAGGRYRIGDERFANAAKDAQEAADCFLIKARGHPAELVRLALIVWPAIWRDYGGRGRYIVNMSVSSESAAMAMSAAEKYLEHA